MTDSLAEGSVRREPIVPREQPRAEATTAPSAASTLWARYPSRGRLATWALSVAMIALSLSWFGSFALPVAVVANVLAALTLIFKRAQRELAWWALGLSLASAACSVYWIWQDMLQSAAAG